MSSRWSTTAVPPGLLRERAPAKINLTLHVTGRRDDGYHLLDSLVAFARVADELTLDPARPLGLSVRGPTAQASGDPAGNLVLRATQALAERVPDLALGHFDLLKRLPVAAGIGGGSSDAGAALRLLARLNGLATVDERLAAAARATGSDVPVCLAAVSRRMAGTGEQLSPPVTIRRMAAVLVNPGVPTPTGPVFKALGLQPGAKAAGTPHPTLEGCDTTEGLVACLAACRNDLQAPAVSLEPGIGLAIALLQKDPDCRLARMSGSGATVFGLYDTCRLAARAARAIRAAQPTWWAVTTMIG